MTVVLPFFILNLEQNKVICHKYILNLEKKYNIKKYKKI